jgi:3-phosphoshikimate 1-carboxyvinyltransferase
VDWPAPLAGEPLSATVTVPGSKSMTNRALVLAALATGRSELVGPLDARDSRLMATGLGTLGVPVETAAGTWSVTSAGPPLQPVGRLLDVGNAGTVARFLPPISVLAKGDLRFDGDPRIRERPVGPLIAALRELGADVVDDGAGRLPFEVRGTGRLTGGSVTLDASGSSQLVSGLLLAGGCYDRGLEVRHDGGPLPSRPHIRMTVAMLQAAGVEVTALPGDRWRVAPGPPAPRVWRIEPDLSAAAPFLAAAAVAGGSVRLAGWPTASAQPGAGLPDLLARFGATVQVDEDAVTVSGTSRLHGVDLEVRDCPELVPVLVVLAAMADRPSRLRGIGHLRRQETNRPAALCRELTALGGDVVEDGEDLLVRPARLHGGLFHTYDDHRLVMAAAVLGLVVPGLLVENVDTVGKTLPDFVARWDGMLRAGR